MASVQYSTASVTTDPVQPTLRERAAALAPRIAERALDVDERRDVHPDSIEEMKEAGLLRAFIPAAYGGLEAAPDDFVGAVIEIAKACTSTGWVLSVLGLHHWEMAQMTKELQDELYADGPDRLISSSYAARGKAERVPGGYRISGRWRTSSGVLHSTWAILGAEVDVEGVGPVPHNFLVPLSETEILDDWFVLGMRGTASRSIVGENLFVPDHRVMDREILFAGAGPGLRFNTNPLYRIPEGILLGTQGGSSALGCAWGFIDEFMKQAVGRVRRLDGVDLGRDRSTSVRLAEARALLEDHEKAMLGGLHKAHLKVIAGEVHTPAETAHGVYDMSRAATAALSVAQSLMPLLGAPAVYATNPLNRMYRDLLTCRQHGTQDTEVTGPALLRIEAGITEGSNFSSLSEERRAAAHARAERLYG